MGSVLYQLDFYRYDCVSAQGLAWDYSPDLLRERVPEVFEGRYGWKITRLTRTTPPPSTPLAEVVETSPDFVSWWDYHTEKLSEKIA